jgi:hypothetical protein
MQAIIIVTSERINSYNIHLSELRRQMTAEIYVSGDIPCNIHLSFVSFYGGHNGRLQGTNSFEVEFGVGVTTVINSWLGY